MDAPKTHQLMAIRIWAVTACDAPWGDYGAILIGGLSAHRDRVGGRIQLERTGPFVPPISLPGLGDVIATSNARARITSAALTGCVFLPVDKIRVTRVVWANWDTTEPLPPDLPASGEPEDYVLGAEHDQGTSEELGQLWELVPEVVGRAEQRRLSRMPRRYEFDLDVDGPCPDFFRPEGTRRLFISERARGALGEDACRWLQFHEVLLR
jgi:hypothetical protein